MPQLDRLVFGGEVLFLVIVFLGLYLILVKNGLPILYKILVLRKEKLNHLRNTVLSLTKENFFLLSTNEQYLYVKITQVFSNVQDMFNVVHKVEIKSTDIFFCIYIDNALESFIKDSVLISSYKNSIFNMNVETKDKIKLIERCY
jgi:hypothetical protein